MTPYLLKSSANGGALEQEKARNFEGEKPQTDGNIEDKGLDSDALLVLSHPCLAVEEVQESGITAQMAAIGHDDRWSVRGIDRSKCKTDRVVWWMCVKDGYLRSLPWLKRRDSGWKLSLTRG